MPHVVNEMRPLNDQDRYTFAGASDAALINVEHEFAVIIDKADEIMGTAWKVEAVGVNVFDGDPITYMFIVNDEDQAHHVANSILSWVYTGLPRHDFLMTMIKACRAGSACF